MAKTKSKTRKPPPRIEGDVAYIPLTKGYEAVIDLADLEEIDRYNWHAHVMKGPLVYAVRAQRAADGRGGQISMHRHLVTPPEGMQVDHKDRNTLNNRRSNLRMCTAAENQHNRKTCRNNKLGIKGVVMAGRRYAAHIRHQGKNVYLGLYDTPAEAAAAYAAAATVAFGQFARSDALTPPQGEG